jgi:predicted Zn-dependent protease
MNNISRKLILLTLILTVNRLVIQAQIVQAQTIREKSEVDLIIESNQTEPDWIKVSKDMGAKYGIQKADSITRAIKFKYYFKKADYSRYIHEYVQFIRKYNVTKTPGSKNSSAMRVFEYGTAPEDLLQAETWVIEALNKEPANPYFMDTYASILYKTGRLEKALTWQTRAVWIMQLDSRLIATLFKMKAGLPIWKYPLVLQDSIDRKSQDRVWAELQQEITQCANEKTLQARLDVSKSNEDWETYTHTIVSYVEQLKPKALQLNNYAWDIFKYSTNRSELEKALAWSNESLQGEGRNNYVLMDTYANLLHKLGKQKQAIAWSEKALALAPAADKPVYEATLAKIKKGEKTWTDE